MSWTWGRRPRALLAAALALAAPACAASADPGAAPGVHLALGDSVTFGFRGGEDAETYRDAANSTGFPELLVDDLGLEVRNASCPGETTESFLDVTAQSTGCQDTLTSETGFRDTSPLHVEYASADQSQLEYALATLGDSDVELVTLMIGANDAFLCQATTADQCRSELGTMASNVRKNIDHVLATLRGEGGYDGTIVVVTYYALDYSGWEAAATRSLDDAIAAAATANDALVADGYAAFRPAAEAAGGSSVAAGLVLPDDIHPSAEGQQLLAEAVTAVLPD